jgi:quercetin dioxygenase-like cupin family protein
MLLTSDAAQALTSQASIPTREQTSLAHHFAGGLYAKETAFPAGSILVQHKHHYDHFAMLASGSVELEVDGQRSEFRAPQLITIRAHQHHGVKALTDVVWFCIHATTETDPTHVDEVLIEQPDLAAMHAIAEVMA